MDAAGGVPEPLLPPQIALQNPKLIGGESFCVLPGLESHRRDARPRRRRELRAVPHPDRRRLSRAGRRRGVREHARAPDRDRSDGGIAYFAVESRTEPLIYARRCDFATGTVETLDQSPYGAFPAGFSSDHSRVVLGDQYLPGDVVLYEPGANGRTIIYGTPLDEREPGREYPAAGIGSTHITPSARGMLLTSAIFDDAGSPGYLDFSRPGEVEPVAFDGIVHTGAGELEQLQHLDGDRYAAIFNIDGCSWVYDVRFDEPARKLAVDRVLVGEGDLAGGVLHGLDLDKESGSFALSFCTATMPTQLYVLDETPGAEDARARARARAGAPRAGRGRLVRPRTTASASPPASTCRPSASASTGRGRSSTSSTAARRARSAPTSPGSRCRSSRS